MSAEEQSIVSNTDTNLEEVVISHITTAQRNKAKGEGFLSNKDGKNFSARVITENGVLNSKQLTHISKAADLYAMGRVSFTSRLTVEIPGIPYDNIERIKEYLKKEGLSVGGTGARVRPIVACKGTVCIYGNIDTQGIAEEIHKRFYDGYSKVILPHKFKIGIGGCPNNCIKPSLNDVGIVGQAIVRIKSENCKSCKSCNVVKSCYPKAATVMENGKIHIDEQTCINCGICVKKCNFNAIEIQSICYKLFIGGRWGKDYRIGSALNKLFNKEEMLNMIEKVILFYKEFGEKGERLSSAIERIGFKQVEDILLQYDIQSKKQKVIND